MSGHLAWSEGRTIAVRDGLVIGRVAGCDVVIDDSKASRRHARIVVDAGVVEIEDLGSSNGTLLNGKPVTRRLLRDRDEVQIGSTVLVYREGPVPGAVSAPAAAVGGSDPFGDDDDLFGGAGTAPIAAPPASPVPPAAPAPPAAARPAPPPAAAPPPPAAPPPARGIVEFADEVVEVRKRDEATPKSRTKDSPAPGPAVQSQQRILQFHKKDAGSGLLGDDLGQMGGGTKLLIYALVLAAGVGIAYGLVTVLR